MGGGGGGGKKISNWSLAIPKITPKTEEWDADFRRLRPQSLSASIRVHPRPKQNSPESSLQNPPWRDKRNKKKAFFVAAAPP